MKPQRRFTQQKYNVRTLHTFSSATQNVQANVLASLKSKHRFRGRAVNLAVKHFSTPCVVLVHENKVAVLATGAVAYLAGFFLRFRCPIK